MYLIAGMDKSAHCSPAWAFSKPQVDTCVHIFSMMDDGWTSTVILLAKELNLKFLYRCQNEVLEKRSS